MNDETLKKISDILIDRAEASFAFFADHRDSEGIFDVSFYSDMDIDEYDLRVLENEIEKLLGAPTELNNLKECDCLFIGEILAGAQLIHCSNERKKKQIFGFCCTGCRAYAPEKGNNDYQD